MEPETYRIGLDLDGVVYNWGDTVRYLVREYWGINLPESTHWDFVQENIPEEAWQWLWTKGVELGLFRHGHLFKGAIEGVRDLAQLGDVAVITHRPKNAIKDTLAFLDYHFGELKPYPFTDIHLLTNQEPKSMVECDVYIDDSPNNVLDLVAFGADVVVFDQLWNRTLWQSSGDPDELYVERAHGWNEVPGIVSALKGRDYQCSSV